MILWIIGIPSLKLSYMMDEILDAELTVIINQSNWSYEYTDYEYSNGEVLPIDDKSSYYEICQNNIKNMFTLYCSSDTPETILNQNRLIVNGPNYVNDIWRVGYNNRTISDVLG
jgi:hypothetical protein